MDGGIEDWDERIFAQTVAVLYKRGMSELVQLLLEVQRFEFVYQQAPPWGGASYDLTLDVEDHVIPLFTEEIKNQLSTVFHEVVERASDQTLPIDIVVRPALPSVDTDWRSTYAALVRSKQTTNQGRKERLVANSPTDDGLFFGSAAELQVYQCLKGIQGKSREDQTFAIFPLAGGRLRSGHTWTPDFLVVGNGRAVIFEVDGPHHRQQRRYADDKSRDLHWMRCGVQVVRIHAEDTRGDKELTSRLQEELRRWLLR